MSQIRLRLTCKRKRLSACVPVYVFATHKVWSRGSSQQRAWPRLCLALSPQGKGQPPSLGYSHWPTAAQRPLLATPSGQMHTQVWTAGSPVPPRGRLVSGPATPHGSSPKLRVTSWPKMLLPLHLALFKPSSGKACLCSNSPEDWLGLGKTMKCQWYEGIK